MTYPKQNRIVDDAACCFLAEAGSYLKGKIGLLNRLPDDEQEKYHRYWKKADRDMFLCARTVLREDMVRKLSVAYDLPLSYTSYRKPYLEGYPGYRFNISHSAGTVAIGFSPYPVGVDIEQIPVFPKDEIMRMAKAVFHPREIAWLQGHDDRACRYFFTRLWTLKESLIKAIGMGFYLDTKQFALNDGGALSSEGVFRLKSYLVRYKCFDEKDNKQLAIAYLS